MSTTLLIPAVALGNPTVTLTLLSTQEGPAVPAGATVDWTINASVSVGDNGGLALICCDLVQDAGNPALLDIPPADGVPTGMANFSRPAGISNPGETDPVTGYVGVQRGVAGQMNLLQIGGAQTTFGQPLPPGTGVGESANVIAGVGQGTPQIVASGSFVAPGTCGVYTFRLQNGLSNVLVQRNDPPAISPVTPATVDAASAIISFTVTLAADFDLDGDADFHDLAALLAHYNTLSGATHADGDADLDGDVDFDDLAELLAVYGAACP